ncbi:MAG: substrate-binding domain-containing protein, partial [Psychrosphaera sp.]|nr:substrate-binding domain-containing protein [Psychrosphaera sp.]
KEAGIDFDPQLVKVGDYQIESGITAAQALLMLKQRPTAIFCFNDEMAIGAMSFIQDLGYHIPNDISIIGFDDIRFAQFSTPSLTTIRQPVEDIGSNCMNMLIDLMTGEGTKSDYIELPVTLVERNSTAPVRG